MMVDGTMFTVWPNTVLLITRKRSAFGLRSERTLSLESGWVNLSTAQTKSRITTPEAEATVDERSEAVVAYDTQAGTGSFASHRGAMKVAAQDGTIRNVGELQKVVQSNGGLSEARALPEAPVIAAPADNFDLMLEATDTVELSWQPVKGAASTRFRSRKAGSLWTTSSTSRIEPRRRQLSASGGRIVCLAGRSVRR